MAIKKQKIAASKHRMTPLILCEQKIKLCLSETANTSSEMYQGRKE